MTEAIGEIDVDYTRGFGEIPSVEKETDPRDVKVSEISERTIGEYPTSSSKELTGWHPAPKDRRVETLAKGMGVQTATMKTGPAMTQRIDAPFIPIPDSNSDLTVQSQIFRLSNEARDLRDRATDAKSMGRTIMIVCTVVGFLLFVAGLIPGLLIGWAIRELVYNRKADRLNEQANRLETEVFRLTLLLRQGNPLYQPPAEPPYFPQSTAC